MRYILSAHALAACAKFASSDAFRPQLAGVHDGEEGGAYLEIGGIPEPDDDGETLRHAENAHAEMVAENEATE